MNKIAVFFDADNVAAVHAPWILEELKAMGEIYIVKVFGDFSIRKDWVEFAKENAIQAFHVPAVKGKNGSDITLTVEVMKTLESRAVDLFALASSDSDFSALALAIKERGHKVIGFGEKDKTIERARKSFNVFIFLPESVENKKTTAAKTPAKTAETAKNVENKTSAESKTTPETSKITEPKTTAETQKIAEPKTTTETPKVAEPKKIAEPKTTKPQKLTTQQITDLWQILNEIFIAKKEDYVDDEGFMFTSDLCAFLTKRKIRCTSYNYKTWKSLFINNPKLGEYKKIDGKPKFKLNKQNPR